MATALNTASELVKEASRREAGGGVVLYARIEGEINLHNSPALRSDLLKLVEEEHPRTIVLNLAMVPYMDSSAIAVLVEVLKAIRAGGGNVHLTQLQQRVAGLLHIARLDTIFVLNDADEAAFAAVGEPHRELPTQPGAASA
jgi:anti-sigma B factor antagonist